SDFRPAQWLVRADAGGCMIIGFLLLVSACGHDACDALPVSERVMQLDECQKWITLIHEKRPATVLYCLPVNDD
ncbi:hypothetical protein VSX61_21990, partial [Brenneria populi subsp. brevivirga]|uniref:hypothetical protein n=1 Tax=Brenneria populi TaxID=1505588 RepID=UPI002E18525E|nr:hypothetical protein [Brenneria populi subsp. brevivirga]